jgi:hypothetical protein
MTPVYQTIIDPISGNCMQAAYATLFDLPIEDVPNFVAPEHYQRWGFVLRDFLERLGYKEITHLYSHSEYDQWKLERVKDFDGVNGYFYASVHSPKFNPDGKHGGPGHAVIVDKNLNIVWDPNPNYVGIKYPLSDNGYNGILRIDVIEKFNYNETEIFGEAA